MYIQVPAQSRAPRRYKRVLTIAGSDSCGGAGIQADLKTLTVLGSYGMSVITALTAQNTRGVQGIFPVATEFVRSQLDSVLSDIPCDAVKIGMLGNTALIEMIAEVLSTYAPPSIVLDPVMIAKGGAPLVPDEAIATMRRSLIPIVTLVTPNLPEASALLNHPVQTINDMETAAHALIAMGPKAVLLKGGHLVGDSCNDCLAYRVQSGETEIEWFDTPRLASENTHGTGCTLSAAIAHFLASDFPLVDAIRAAKEFITGAIQSGTSLSIGKGHGPVDHLWQRHSLSHNPESKS